MLSTVDPWTVHLVQKWNPEVFLAIDLLIIVSYIIPKPNQNKNPTNSKASTQACPFLMLVTSREEPPLYPEFPLPGDTLTSRHSDYTKFFSLPYVISNNTTGF